MESFFRVEILSLTMIVKIHHILKSNGIGDFMMLMYSTFNVFTTFHESFIESNIFYILSANLLVQFAFAIAIDIAYCRFF